MKKKNIIITIIVICLAIASAWAVVSEVKLAPTESLSGSSGEYKIERTIINSKIKPSATITLFKNDTSIDQQSYSDRETIRKLDEADFSFTESEVSVIAQDETIYKYEF